MLPATPSSWNKYPTKENPNNKYKFTNIIIDASLDQKIIARGTYSVLDFVGDLGGFYSAFTSIGSILVSPVAGFALNAKLLSMIFRTRTSKKSNSGPMRNLKEPHIDITDIQDDFRSQNIGRLNYWVATLGRKTKYKKLIEKSYNSLSKELDLQKFVHR